MIKLSKGKYTGNIKGEIHQHNVLINIIHYSPEHETIGLHYHENPHLCLLLQGGDKESRRGTSYIRSCGELFFYHAGDAHATILQNNLTKSLVVEFEESFLKKYSLIESQIEATIKHNPSIKFQLLKLLYEVKIKDNCKSLSVESLLLNLFTSTQYQIGNSIPKWLEIVDDVLREKWNQTISLEELSIAAKVHPVTISKYFSKYLHCTLGYYIRKIRIEKSIPLVKNTKMPLVEIGYHCGFADQSHFIRTFKDTTGFLPSELRKL